MDLCKNCIVRGKQHDCEHTKCNMHNSWLVEQLKAENERLLEALDDIVNPLKYLQKRVPEGHTMDGHTTTSLLNSVEFHRDIARQALYNK